MVSSNSPNSNTLSKSTELYLGALLELSHSDELVKTSLIAKYLSITPASATEMFQRLSQLGYVEYQRYHGVRLTERGYNVALKLKQRILLLKHFLEYYIGFNEADALEEANNLGYIISNSFEQRLWKVLFPSLKEDEIGDAEQLITQMKQASIVRLADLSIGKKGVISVILVNPENREELVTSGLEIGTQITAQEDNYYLVKDQQTKISPILLSRIYVITS